MSAPYDSRPDTLSHIARVGDLLGGIILELSARANEHDASKLVSPEREAFDEATPKLATLTYGSDEYRATLRGMKPTLIHHYANNSHHPEHHADGIRGMSLLDLIEMLCDWKAAGERHADNPGLAHSIEINQARFGYSDELKSILLSTVAAIE